MKHILFFLFSFCSIFLFAQKRPSLIPYLKKDKWGYCDTTKKIIIPIQYNQAFPFVQGKAIVETAEGKIVQIDSRNKIVRSFPYMMAGYLDNIGLIQVYYKKEKLYGLINLNGSIIVPVMYEKITVLRSDSIEVKLNGLKGIVDSKNNIIKKFIPYNKEEDLMDYDYLITYSNCETPCFWRPFSEGMAVVGHKKKFGYGNESKELIIPCKYNIAESFKNGLARVTADIPGQIKKQGYEKDGVIYDSPTYIATFYIDKQGVEYCEP